MHERRVATLRELEEYYSLDDLRLMHLGLDVLADLELAQADAIEARRKT